MANFCPTCSEYSPGDFCTICGIKAIPMPQCLCGEQIWPYQHFCGGCGRSRVEALKPKKPGFLKWVWLGLKEYFK